MEIIHRSAYRQPSDTAAVVVLPCPLDLGDGSDRVEPAVGAVDQIRTVSHQHRGYIACSRILLGLDIDLPDQLVLDHANDHVARELFGLSGNPRVIATLQVFLNEAYRVIPFDHNRSITQYVSSPPADFPSSSTLVCGGRERVCVDPSRNIRHSRFQESPSRPGPCRLEELLHPPS